MLFVFDEGISMKATQSFKLRFWGIARKESKIRKHLIDLVELDCDEQGELLDPDQLYIAKSMAKRILSESMKVHAAYIISHYTETEMDSRCTIKRTEYEFSDKNKSYLLS